MKKKYIQILLVVAILILLTAWIVSVKLQVVAPTQPKTYIIQRREARPPQPPPPEYREPPLKEYRPPQRQLQYQQVGILLGGAETLPLYGKESLTRRNQWHYYTATPGFQIYPLPISKDGRDCMEDIGCNEFYGNETVSVTGKDGVDYQSKIYRTENFPYRM